MNYGAEQDTDLTVSGYIFSELQADDIEFHIPLYKKMFDLYFELEKDMDQDRLTMHFLNNPDTEIAEDTPDGSSVDYTLADDENTYIGLYDFNNDGELWCPVVVNKDEPLWCPIVWD